jgi:tetratricopeptide (TPR) repeat protein
MKPLYCIFSTNYRKSIIILIAAFVVFPVLLSAQKTISQKQAREFIRQGNIQEAIIGYARLASIYPDNTTILMEYAYALALGNIPDGALMYLDRAKLLGAGNEYYFYTAQTLSLMGHKGLADVFRKTKVTDAPVWLSTNTALPERSSPVKINSDSAHIAYSRANKLAADGLHLQSIVLLLELISEYPDIYFPYLTASIVFENMNLYDKAAELLEKSITLINEALKIKEDAELKDALPALTAHLTSLKQQTYRKQKEKYHPQIMVYGGGMYSSQFVSVNARSGVFLSNSMNAALDLGISGGGGNTFVNLGLSAYERWKFLVGGLGFSAQFGETTVYNFRSTVGFSFLHKNGNRSVDLFLNIDVPMQKDAKTVYGISIGRSFYFGKRKR